MLDRNNTTLLQTKEASCLVSHYGAQVLSYQTKEVGEIFWLSPKAIFTPGSAIRGGNPLCWPRFGQEEIWFNLPKHGIARLVPWQVDEIRHSKVQASMQLSLPGTVFSQYALPAELQVRLVIHLTDQSLTITWHTSYHGIENFSFTQAQHAYFAISDIQQISLEGLVDGRSLSVNQSVDQVFYPHQQKIVLTDLAWSRQIFLTKQGSSSTVLWNPYQDLSVPDMEEQAYRHFICIEPANTLRQPIVLNPLKPDHELSMKIWAKKNVH